MEPRFVVRVKYEVDEKAAQRVLEILRQGFKQGLKRRLLEKKTG